MKFGFRYAINVPPWVTALWVLGMGIILFWTGTSVTRWILLATIITELIAVVIYRAYPQAVQAVFRPLESMPSDEAAVLATLTRGDRHGRLALLRSYLAFIVLLACVLLLIVAGAFLFLYLGF